MVRVRVICPIPLLSCAYSSTVRVRPALDSGMSTQASGGHGYRRQLGAQQLRQQARDAREAAEVDAAAAGGGRAEVARQPRSERPWVQLVGMQDVDEAHIAQTLGTDPLLRLGPHPRHDQRVLL